MCSPSEPKSAVIRNAVFLYVRTLVVGIADFFAVKLLLTRLGVADYGVYSSVAGVVTAFLFLNGAIESTAVRFLSVAFSRDGDLRNVPSALAASFLLLAGLCVVNVALIETVGRWFLGSHVDFAPEARPLVGPLFQLGVAEVVLRTLRVPFSAVFLARERMSFFAKTSVLEGSLPVLSALLIPVVPMAGLLVYGVGRLMSEGGLLVLFGIRGMRMVGEIVFRLDLRQLREQVVFLASRLLTSLATLAKYQGVCLVVSSGYGTLFAASWHLSMTVGNSCLWNIIACLYGACYPRAVKIWITQGRDGLAPYAVRTSFLSMAALSLVVLPLLIWSEGILSSFFGHDLPPQATAFVRCVAIHFLMDSMAKPIDAAIYATGRIVCYEAILAVVTGSGLAFAVALSALGAPAWTTVGAVAATNALALLFRLAWFRVRLGVPLPRLASSVSASLVDAIHRVSVRFRP